MSPTAESEDDPAVDLAVDLARELPASPARVFRAWTDPTALAQWFSGHARVELEPAVGGRLMVDMRDARASHVHEGEFLEFEPPRDEGDGQRARLAFTWRSEATGGARTEVRIEIEGNRRRSRIRLTHTGLADAGMAEDHRAGWAEILETLEDYLSL